MRRGVNEKLFASMKIVLIIGNGFDLDLGWKTTFSQFAASSFWPQRPKEHSNLYLILNQQRSVSGWFDLESLLAQYASIKGGKTAPSNAWRDKAFFEQLAENLSGYLLDQQVSNIREDSSAEKVLRAVLAYPQYAKIYSFNYTNLNGIATRLGINAKFNYEHVHGCLDKGTPILGIPDSIDVHSQYEFLYKTFNRCYSSHPIPYDLMEADEVIFFGHSLGSIDYHYFQQFFQMQVRPDMKREEGKKITIFTYDDNSRMSILKQLREMNDKKTNVLYTQNDMNIIMTDGTDEANVQAFLSSFNKRMTEEISRTGYHIKIRRL